MGTGCRARLTQDVLVSLSQCPDLLRPARRHSDLPSRDMNWPQPVTLDLVTPAEIPSDYQWVSPVQPMPGQCGRERAQARVWAVMSVMGSSKEFILRKYFDELQKFWATQQRLDGEWRVLSGVWCEASTLGTDDLIWAGYHLLDLKMIQNSSCDDWWESTSNTEWWPMILVLE